MGNLKIITIIFLFAFWKISASESGIKKYYNYYPEDILKLSDKLKESDVPIVYNQIANQSTWNQDEVIYAHPLNSLMYSGVGNYLEAVKDFQKDLGFKPDGKLTVGQIHDLLNRSKLQELKPISFPNRFYSDQNEAFALIEGTWIIQDEKIAYPINHVKIECNLLEKMCTLNQIDLMKPNINGFSYKYMILSNDPIYYDITSWEKNRITAKPTNDKSSCRTRILDLNFATKEYYEIIRNKGKECEVLGEKLPLLKKPRISQIVDGEEIFRKEFKKVNDDAYEVLSSKFKKKTDELISILEKKEKKAKEQAVAPDK